MRVNVKSQHGERRRLRNSRLGETVALITCASRMAASLKALGVAADVLGNYLPCEYGTS